MTLSITITKAKQTLSILKALTFTKQLKQKTNKLSLHTFKAITRPILEYANTTWSPITSNTNIKKLQTIQNAALRIATGCTRDTNIQHLPDQTKVLLMSPHLKFYAIQFKQVTQTQTYSLYDFDAYQIHTEI